METIKFDEVQVGNRLLIDCGHPEELDLRVTKVMEINEDEHYLIDVNHLELYPDHNDMFIKI